MKLKYIPKRKSSFTGSAVLLMLVVMLQLSCSKLIEVDVPETLISSENIYNDDATAISAITGLYGKMSRSGPITDDIGGVSGLTGLLSDELTLHPTINNDRLEAYYRNDLQTIISGKPIWGTGYSSVYTINAALENISNSEQLSPEVKKQLLGEARFLRAFYYFYLVNLFGDVPLVLTTDYSINETMPRTPKEDVYKQIVIDLTEAKQLLSPDFLGANLKTQSQERVRPTSWAATALRARVYLYMGDWANAEIDATAVINQPALFKMEPLGNVFKKTGIEAIWELQPVNTGWNTEDARTFVIPSTGFNGQNPAYLSDTLLESFEANDNRKTAWLGSYNDATATPSVNRYYPFKYKSATLNDPVTEYSIVFRLAEQYLIRAEARAQQNNISGAQDDLNVIRTRAGLLNTSASDKDALLNAILHERQVELFTEWGHRWLDLKRTGKVDAVMSVVTPLKGGTWNTNWQWYPIPLGDILSNPNLTQNSGYN